MDQPRHPGTAARFPKLLELGSGKHSDLELNFGRRLGGLWNENEQAG
jgi:hypothetical protein